MKNRVQPALVFCMLIGVSTPVASISEQNDFCPIWMSVYDTAFRGFAPWRGAYSQDDEKYQSTVKFPGAESCQIDDDEFDHGFTCFWKYEYNDDAQSSMDALVLSRAIRSCIGRGPPSAAVVNQTPHLIETKRAASRRSTMVWTDTIVDTGKHIETSIAVIRSEALENGRVRLKASQSMQVSIQMYKY